MTEETIYITLFEAPKIEVPEFRLYYDDAGKVVCYTSEKLDGNYIVIDARTYAEGRPDLRVIHGKISTVNPNFIVCKLMPNSNEGVLCAEEDISIIVAPNTKLKTTKWKLETYELNG